MDYEICKSGDIENVKFLIKQKGYIDWNDGFCGACEGGHLEIAEFMIEKGSGTKIDWNYGLLSACECGHMDLVKLLIEKGANDWDLGLFSACRGGHLEIVKFMIEKGADAWDHGLRGACRDGHFEIAKFMIEKGAVYDGKNGKFNNYIEIEHGLEPLLPDDLVRMVNAR